MEEKRLCSKCGELKLLETFRTSGRQCRDCRNSYARERYNKRADVRERHRILVKEYNQHPEIKAKKKEYNQRPEIKERNRKRSEITRRSNGYREYKRRYDMLPENKKRHRESSQKYYQKLGYECKRINSSNYRTRIKGLPSTLTEEKWKYALNYFNGCCAVCGRQLNDIFREFTAAADHWIPLSYGGDDNPGTVEVNIVPLCHGVGGCNNSKSNKMPDEWLEWKFGKQKAKQISKRVQKYFAHIKELEADALLT